jgi:hypothetical protein
MGKVSVELHQSSWIQFFVQSDVREDEENSVPGTDFDVIVPCRYHYVFF